MTTTPVTLLSKRSGNASDRPLTTTVQNGELAINFAAADNGLYFKDSLGDIRKITGTHYGTTAPNATPAGETGNSVGEMWVNSSTSAYYLQVWDGGAWQKIGAAFADNAASATVTIASGAIVANSSVVASGAFGSTIASGVFLNVFTGSFPATASTGSFAYKNDAPSGLYVSANGGWVPAYSA